MKAYQVQGKGLEHIALVACEQKHPKANEVVVKVKAVSLNYRDLMIAKGGYGRNVNYPVIPASDGAGEVVAVGDAVQGLQIKDRVVGMFFPYWQAGEMTPETNRTALGGDVDGMLAEYITLPETSFVRIPDSMSYEEAATLPCAGLTAWNALYGKENLRPGQSVLTMGTGGVSMFALQFAKAGGAHVIATSGADDKLAKAQKIGADEVINYKTTPDWDKQVHQLTHNRGVDHIVEVGGAGTFSKSLHAVCIGGTISMIGVLTGASAPAETILILGKSINVRGIYVGNRQQFVDMLRCIVEKNIHPVIDRVYDFSNAKEAFAALESATHVGKIVIRI